MKVVITGATGFVGQETLKQCIDNSSITSIVVLSRRQLPEPVTSPKVKVIVLDNFLEYSQSTRSELQGAQACLWALGNPYMPADEEAKKVSIGYTMAAAKVFTEHAEAKKDLGQKFRFVYVSGAAVERDQNKSLWFLGPYRRIRGQVEIELVEYAKKNSAAFETYIVRPGMIFKRGYLATVGQVVAPSITVDSLAKAMIDIAFNGHANDTLSNADILGRAKTLSRK